MDPLFQIFDQQFLGAKASFNALGKNLKSRKALDLKERLIFIKIYLRLISKIHFTKEESLKFEPFEPFLNIFKSLKRVHHFKLALAAYEGEMAKTEVIYTTYDKFLSTVKDELYKEVYEVLLSAPLDIWELLYATAFHYSHGNKPLMINTSATKLINEEIEYIKYISYKEKGQWDCQSIKEIREGMKTVTLVENIKIAAGLNSFFTKFIHGEIKKLNQVLNKWYENHLFAQHLNFFLSEREDVGSKYLEMAKRIKYNKKRLTGEVVSLCTDLFPKVSL